MDRPCTCRLSSPVRGVLPAGRISIFRREAGYRLAVRYTPFFCEENVWHLAQDRSACPGERAVVFILGADPARPAVALWQQRAAATAPFVVWDYHVVLFDRPTPGTWWEVWDQDSTLGMPQAVESWLAHTFPIELPGLLPRFRVVDAAEYLRTFSSDRRHMRAPDGAPLHPLPAWPPILDAEGRHLLPRFLDITDTSAGELCDRDGLRARFVAPHGG